MNNLVDLKAIWHTAKTDSLPGPEEIVQQIRKFRARKLRGKWLVIVCSCLLSLLIIIILCIVHFHLVSTYIGGMLMAASGLLLAATNIRSLRRFYHLEDHSNVEFLAFIERTSQNQIYYYKKTQAIVILLWAVGLLLYLYELTSRHPSWLIGIYFVSIGYLLMMWFVVRPHYFKKNQEKLNAIRQRLEKILNQFK